MPEWNELRKMIIPTIKNIKYETASNIEQQCALLGLTLKTKWEYDHTAPSATVREKGETKIKGNVREHTHRRLRKPNDQCGRLDEGRRRRADAPTLWDRLTHNPNEIARIGIIQKQNHQKENEKKIRWKWRAGLQNRQNIFTLMREKNTCTKGIKTLGIHCSSFALKLPSPLPLEGRRPSVCEKFRGEDYATARLSAVQKRKGKKEREGARVCRATLLYCKA